MSPPEFLIGVVIGLALALLFGLFIWDGQWDKVGYCLIGIGWLVLRKLEKGKVDWEEDE